MASRLAKVWRKVCNVTPVSLMVNLTTLAPDILVAILDDTLPNHISCSIWRLIRRRCGMSRGTRFRLKHLTRNMWTSRKFVHVDEASHSQLNRRRPRMLLTI
jgi:hypothetical protein